MRVPKVSLQEGIYCMSKRENYLIIVDRSTHVFHRITSIPLSCSCSYLCSLSYCSSWIMCIKGFVYCLSLDCHF